MAFRPQEDGNALENHKPEEIVAKLRHVDGLVAQGKAVADAIRTIGVTAVTYLCRVDDEGIRVVPTDRTGRF